jgi:hypothetical protein
MRGASPGHGFGWMAGVMGLLVAGGLLRRRSVPSGDGPRERAAPGPDASPALPPARQPPGGAHRPEAAPPPFAVTTRQDTDSGAPARSAPRIRRGPSGREHFWLEPEPAPLG